MFGTLPSSFMAEPGLRHVFVHGLEVMAHIGIYEAEKQKAQRVILTIDLAVREETLPLADEINAVVSYEDVAKRAEAIAVSGHTHLVESLAERIAAACLEDARVFSARVRVEKPDILPNARSVGVEIERRRR